MSRWSIVLWDKFNCLTTAGIVLVESPAVQGNMYMHVLEESPVVAVGLHCQWVYSRWTLILSLKGISFFCIQKGIVVLQVMLIYYCWK